MRDLLKFLQLFLEVKDFPFYLVYSSIQVTLKSINMRLNSYTR